MSQLTRLSRLIAGVVFDIFWVPLLAFSVVGSSICYRQAARTAKMVITYAIREGYEMYLKPMFRRGGRIRGSRKRLLLQRLR